METDWGDGWRMGYNAGVLMALAALFSGKEWEINRDKIVEYLRSKNCWDSAEYIKNAEEYI